MEDLRNFDPMGHQAARDDELRRIKFTGAEFDLVTRDWQVWDRGVCVGYVKTRQAGQRLLSGVSS